VQRTERAWDRERGEARLLVGEGREGWTIWVDVKERGAWGVSLYIVAARISRPARAKGEVCGAPLCFSVG
jgi:hypothetical protein